jgi:cytochrome c
MKATAIALLLLAAYALVALAHEGKPEDRKALPDDHHLRAVAYCQGVYTVELTSGASFQYREFNLRFKTDSGDKGPAPGSPVIIPSGMMGDRAFLTFPRPADLSAFIKEKC